MRPPAALPEIGQPEAEQLAIRMSTWAERLPMTGDRYHAALFMSGFQAALDLVVEHPEDAGLALAAFRKAQGETGPEIEAARADYIQEILRVIRGGRVQ